MNANLIHKFPITDEEYNHVEGSVLNVKQKVGNEMPPSPSVAMRQICIIGPLSETLGITYFPV